MVRKRISSGNAAGIACALIVMALGIGLCLTLYGIILGLPLCICALFMGGKREWVLACPNCGARVATA